MPFQYEVLIAKSNNKIPAGIIWYSGSTMQAIGPNLIQILNQLGAQGWEVVGIGNLGFDAGNEIILKKAI
ncbi:MAG: hypothetical protein ABIP06_14405 [Pyrinomonadaceae bacterium]